ncbi:hypothetical protein [Candidatus Poriferisodalis sp.]|uniref:hypothetical protein n=1 Tax=Candidatus Poriferisodalis sp. TaxID=3101277 RepID=UPI003B01A486
MRDCRSGVRRREDQRGEIFPVAVLFGAVVTTILIGLHIALLSMGRTAVQSAADIAVTVAQAAPPGPSSCGTVGSISDGRLELEKTRIDNERECQGVVAAWQAMNASGSMVIQSRPPQVSVDDGVVSVTTFGVVRSPVLGVIWVSGSACELLVSDQAAGADPSGADPSSPSAC